jgi:hypothetical protein
MSLDNLSLMALVVATGFVVDDAIVMIENIVRYIEQGKSGKEAAEIGARQIGFTVLSLTVSLVAVFLPLLLMPGVTGRLFHEFAGAEHRRGAVDADLADADPDDVRLPAQARRPARGRGRAAQRRPASRTCGRAPSACTSTAWTGCWATSA